MTLADLLIRAGRSAGQQPALTEGRRTGPTYELLNRRVAVLASTLRSRFGLQRGARVVLFMKNCPAYVETLFACWYAGLVAVPVNAKLHERELAYILDNCTADLVVATGDLAAVVNAAVLSSERAPDVVEVGSAAWRQLFDGTPDAPGACSPDDVAWLFYTSGTTGRPKGAMLTHRNLIAMTTAFFTNVQHVDRSDGLLHAAPMSHGSGLYILPYVAGMARQIIPESGGFDPAEIFELCARDGDDVSLFAAPTMVHRMIDAAQAASPDLPGLRSIVYGGAPMYLADTKRALSVFGPKLIQIYGQGESPMTITALSKRLHADTSHPRYEARLASVGLAQIPVDVAVVGPSGTPAATNEDGEIVVRGDTVMTGYWDAPEATARALRDGWLHTGDIGSIDEDGFLTLKDRSKDLIISGGSNIYPREVEEVLLFHDAVSEVAVIGRPHPDWGEEVVAYVVPVRGKDVTAADLDSLCLANIARFKRPKDYLLVDALPKNNYGKVLKTELREMDRAREASPR